MTTNEQLIEAVIPILDAARVIDKRITCVIVNVDIDGKPPFIKFYGNKGFDLVGAYGISESMALVKPFDPIAEKMAEMKRLKSEIEKLQSEITGNNVDEQEEGEVTP